MKVVGIFGKPRHPQVEAVGQQLADRARAAGWRVLEEASLGACLAGCEVRVAEEVTALCDLVVVLGGDGTLIRVVRLLDDREIPIFGVNLGFLGYLTEFTAEEAPAEFERVLAGHFETQGRTRLQADLIRADSLSSRTKVLNDVVINTSGMSRIIEIQAEIDGQYVTTFRADGLIVSTPTGSTAYSLSAGGPIVAPNTRALLLVPICPHTLTMRPLVVRDDVCVCLRVATQVEAAQATFDGQHAEPIRPGDRLEIRCAPRQVRLVKPPRDYFKILHAKLKWGG